MGCRGSKAAAAAGVDEPAYHQKDLQKLPTPNKQLKALASSSVSGIATSASIDSKVESTAAPTIAACPQADLVPRPPRPPPPPSATVKGAGLVETPNLSSIAGTVAAPRRPATDVTNEVTVKAVGGPQGGVATSEETIIVAPLADSGSLRAAAATDQVDARAGADLETLDLPEAFQPISGTSESSMPGTISTTPRQHTGPKSSPPHKDAGKPSPSFKCEGADKSAARPVGKPHIGAAFMALGTSSAPMAFDIDSALAMLELDDDCADHEPSSSPSKWPVNSPPKLPVNPLSSPLSSPSKESNPLSSPSKWPVNVLVAPSSRVMVLTWARWSRNSLRIKAEQRLKALQHVKYPKGYYPMVYPDHCMQPLSPQATPRASEANTCNDLRPEASATGLDQGNGTQQELLAFSTSGASFGQPQAPPPTRAGGKRHPAEACPNRTLNGSSTRGRLLFDVMAEERRESMEAQAMKMKLQKNCAIETAHTTETGHTPGFGIETPNFIGASTVSRMSPKDSVVSSGVASPVAGGQVSPWLLEAEAEALVTSDDDFCSPESHHSIPTSNAWGFEPAKLDDVPELESSPCKSLDEEIDDFIRDNDELEQVGLFVAPSPDSPSACGKKQRCSPDKEDQCCSPAWPGSDSRASTATSPAAPSSGRSAGNGAKDGREGKSPKSPQGAAVGLGGLAAALADTKRSPKAIGGPANSCEYAIGDKVSYWSGSRAVWLPAVIVEKKSTGVYLIDKQMKGCLAKVRTSELISTAEEQNDPILRALGAFGTPSSSRSASPRASCSGTPRSASGTPRSSSAIRRGKKAADVDQDLGIASAHRKVESLSALQKVPTIRAAVPPALAGVARLPSVSPRTRGKILRDDFSDDSDDD